MQAANSPPIPLLSGSSSFISQPTLQPVTLSITAIPQEKSAFVEIRFAVSNTSPTHVGCPDVLQILSLTSLSCAFSLVAFSCNESSLASKNSFLSVHSSAVSGVYPQRRFPITGARSRLQNMERQCALSKFLGCEDTLLHVSWDACVMSRSSAMTKWSPLTHPTDTFFIFYQGHQHRPSFRKSQLVREQKENQLSRGLGVAPGAGYGNRSPKCSRPRLPGVGQQ